MADRWWKRKALADPPRADGRQLRATIGFLVAATVFLVLRMVGLVGSRTVIPGAVPSLVVVGFGLFLGRIGLMGIRYRRLVARSRGLSESEDTPNGP